MASRGINKVILVGYLGQEPEVSYMNNGSAITNISIATTDTWRDKQTNELKEKTEWHRVILFGKLAEVASEYLHRGSQVYIEGALRTRKWQQNGEDRYITEVIVNVGSGIMQMLGSRNIENNTSSLSDSNITSDDVRMNAIHQDDDEKFEENDIPF